MSKSSSLTSLDDLRASGSWRLSQVSSLAEWRTTSRLHRPRAGERGDHRKSTSPRAHSGAGGYQHGRRATFTHQSLDPCNLVVYSKRKRRRSILRRLSRAPSSTAYTCGGHFLRDLFELCRERHLPDVPHVVVIRTSQDSSHDREAKDTVRTSGSKSAWSKRRNSASISAAGLKESRKPGSLVKRRKTPSRQSSIQRSVPSTPMASSTSLASAATLDIATSPRTFKTASSEASASAADSSKRIIQVEQDEADDDRTVSAIHIRGWPMDRALMEVLYHCWPALPSLRCLQLPQVDLEGSSFYLLASCLPLCPHLHTLVLDGNPLTDVSLSALLGTCSRPWHLSLRFCTIGDLQVHDLAGSLGMNMAPSSSNTPTIQPADDSLVSLNLSNNDVGDAGAAHLADALKTNRSLLVLNLANNKVGDAGLARLAQTLAWFPLTPEQEKMRRALIHVQLAEQKLSIVVTSPQKRDSQVERVPGKPSKPSLSSSTGSRGSISRLATTHSSSHRVGNASPKRDTFQSKLKFPGKTASKKVTGKKSSIVKREGLSRKRHISLPLEHGQEEKEAVSAPVPSQVDKLRYRPSWYTPQDIAVDCLGPHPFLRAGFLHDGILWLSGNRAVVSLNVSGNRVGRAGVQALLAAVEEQMLPAQDAEQGLRRLVIHRNPVPAGCAELQQLKHKMRRREPGFVCSRISLSKEWIVPCAEPVSVLM